MKRALCAGHEFRIGPFTPFAGKPGSRFARLALIGTLGLGQIALSCNRPAWMTSVSVFAAGLTAERPYRLFCGVEKFITFASSELRSFCRFGLFSLLHFSG